MKKKLMTLNIFGQKWPVYLVEMSDDYLGLTYLDDGYIELNNKIKGQKLTETLMHEFLHALFQRTGFRQSGIPIQLEEVMVDQIAKTLTENFRITKKNSP